jgi:FMN phosphatase YigB (HAD superfamily)
MSAKRDLGSEVGFHAMEVKWCGFDYGQCIMEPGGLRNPLVFGDIYKELGRPELIQDKIRNYRILKEKYGTYSLIKEGHRDEIYSFVLDNDPEAVDLFSRKEQELLLMGEGLEETLAYLQNRGIELQVVSEMKKTLGPVGTDAVCRFLKTRGLVRYFKQLVTPQGKIDLEKDTLDLRYKGSTKKDGTLYDILAQELAERGIAPHEAVMVGDKPETDINPAHDRGFRTIQYKGFIDLGDSKADVVIHSFEELKSILKRKE